MSLVQDHGRLEQANQVAQRCLDEVLPPGLVLGQHVEVWDTGLERVVLLRVTLGREVLDDIAAAVAEELELLPGLTVCACKHKDQDVQVATQLAGCQSSNLMLLPHLNSP